MIRSHSKKAIDWISWEAIARDIDIRHAQNGGEYQIPNTKYSVDGYHAESRTVFEYMGSYFHGDPRLYAPGFWNSLCKKTMGELYQKTLDRVKDIEQLGYIVIQMWEYDDEINPLANCLKTRPVRYGEDL